MALKNAKPKIKLHGPDPYFLENLDKRKEEEEKLESQPPGTAFKKKFKTKEFDEVRETLKRVEMV